MNRKILIAAGGTGGHLFPAQQLADMLQTDSEILFAGYKLSASPFFSQGKGSFAEIAAHPWKKGVVSAVWRGFWQSIRLIRRFQPDVVVGFGSYHAFPVLLAAAALRKKIVLFEANAVLGKVNRCIAPFASQIAFQFPHLYRAPPSIIGSFRCSRNSSNLTVRGIFKKGVQVPFFPWRCPVEEVSCASARVFYGLDPGLDTILVFGGSQGAAFFNEMIPSLLANLTKPVQVIHLSGPQSHDRECSEVRAAYEKGGVRACVKEFEKNMPVAYAAATAAICRSGAGTIGELIRFSVPALLVPYPFAADDHQRKNGEFLVSGIRGAHLLLQRDAERKELFLAALESLLCAADSLRACLRKAHLENQNKIQLAEIIRGLRL